MSQSWVDEMAAMWFVKNKEGLSAAEKEALKAWLGANPKHQEAFCSFERLWAELDEIAPLVACPKPLHTMKWLYACASMVLFVMVGIFGWYSFTHRLEFTHAFKTPTGEIKEYTLSDGTQFFLDTNTHITVSYYAHERTIVVHQGQILLHVKKDPLRDFFVDAKHVRVHVTGTRFEVSHLHDAVRVSVEEGSVDVLSHSIFDTKMLKRASLKENERITLDALNFVKIEPLSHHQPLSPWRDGRLVFDNTPLHEALLEFERYGAMQAVFASETVKKMPLSGSFEVERFGSFVELLPKVLPLKVIKNGDMLTITER